MNFVEKFLRLKNLVLINVVLLTVNINFCLKKEVIELKRFVSIVAKSFMLRLQVSRNFVLLNVKKNLKKMALTIIFTRQQTG